MWCSAGCEDNNKHNNFKILQIKKWNSQVKIKIVAAGANTLVASSHK